VPSPAVTKPAAAENPAPAKSLAKPTAPAAPGATRIELVATEPTWVSIRGGDGATQMSGLIDPGKSQSVDVRQPAVLRAGNAGGLTIRTNGKSLGPLGPHGAVREVEFKNGDFKVIPIK
jgi:cytoskeleton protein RodZ